VDGLTGIGKIGTQYGFDLYIQRHQEMTEVQGKIKTIYQNTLHAKRAETGIKYNYSSGVPNTDNVKLASRYFLHAIDRVDGLVEKYQKQVQEADELIPKLGALIEKSFEKEAELQQLKSSLSNLEREIALKIQEKLEQQQEQAGIKPDLDGPIAGEAIIVNMNGFEGKPETRTDKIVNGANAGSDQDNARIELKKNRGLKI
jgi:hypothetical protein